VQQTLSLLHSERMRGAGKHADQFSVAGIIRVVRVAVGHRFRKFRLAGSETLVRGDLGNIVHGTQKLSG
jgi:molybdenum cofactor biosynthesis enzyme MoaA